MSRRRFLLASLVGALIAPFVEAQVAALPRIAVVFSTSPLTTMLGPDPSHPFLRAFLHGLRDLGYVEGQNLLIERRSLEGRWDRAPEVFTELIGLKVQVILAAPLSVARAARSAVPTIPIVVGDATDLGPEPLIASFARPGGTVTGIGLGVLEFSQKQLELLKEAAPRATRVAVLTEPVTPELRELRIKPMEEAARALRVTLSWAEIKSAKQVAATLDAVIRQHPQALFVPGGATIFAARREIADFVLRHRLPTMTSYLELVEEGGLMAYAIDNQDIYRRTATYIDKILKGAKPGDLPVERPSKFTLLINLRTARAIGITVPQSLLLRADQVIE
jgi:putative ABC transport system substrate-binding protein